MSRRPRPSMRLPSMTMRSRTSVFTCLRKTASISLARSGYSVSRWATTSAASSSRPFSRVCLSASEMRARMRSLAKLLTMSDSTAS